MKRAFFFILILCSICCYSQDFIGNNDYVYAKGVARTQVDAENAALISLANNIGIQVTNVSRYSVTEKEGKVSEEFEKNIGTESSMSFGDEVQTYVEANRKNVIVYKYINVKAYVQRHKTAYDTHLKAADSIYMNCGKIKHSKNLVLGHLYSAYLALDTPLMDVYSNKNVEFKERLMAKIKEYYSMDGSFGYLTLIEKANVGGYYAKMTGNRTKGLHGFEYLHNGNWEIPVYFYYSLAPSNSEGTHDAYSPKKTPRCLLESNSNKIHIRYLYECEKDGVLYKINVPENWYFCDITIDTYTNNVH